MPRTTLKSLQSELDSTRSALNDALQRIERLEGKSAPQRPTREPGSKRPKGTSRWDAESLRNAALARGKDIDKAKFLATCKSCGLAVLTDLRLKFVEGMGYVDKAWLPRRKA